MAARSRQWGVHYSTQNTGCRARKLCIPTLPTRLILCPWTSRPFSLCLSFPSTKGKVVVQTGGTMFEFLVEASAWALDHADTSALSDTREEESQNVWYRSDQGTWELCFKTMPICFYPSTCWCMCFHPSLPKQSRVNSGWSSRPEVGAMLQNAVHCSTTLSKARWLTHSHTLRAILTECLPLVELSWEPQQLFRVKSCSETTRLENTLGSCLYTVSSFISTHDSTCSHKMILENKQTQTCELLNVHHEVTVRIS